MVGDDFYCFMREMLSSKFFTEICDFTEEEKAQKEDWIVLVKGMLLLDVHCNLKWEKDDLSDEMLLEYFDWAKEHYGDCQKNTLRSVVKYLEEAFYEEKVTVNKEMRAKIICEGGKAMYKEITPGNFLKDCIVKV